MAFKLVLLIMYFFSPLNVFDKSSHCMVVVVIDHNHFGIKSVLLVQINLILQLIKKGNKFVEAGISIGWSKVVALIGSFTFFSHFYLGT